MLKSKLLISEFLFTSNFILFSDFISAILPSDSILSTIVTAAIKYTFYLFLIQKFHGSSLDCHIKSKNAHALNYWPGPLC